MPTIKIYSKEQVDALIASAGGLPDPTSASAGDVLTLDSNKDPAWAEPDPVLPDTTSASAGDVLTLDSNKDPTWATPSGGGSDWEYIDPTNLPNDFVAGDKLLLFASVGLGVSASGSGWSATLSSPSLNTNTNIVNACAMIILQNDTNGANRPLCIGQSTTNITNITIGTTQPVNNWNNSATNLNLLNIKAVAFNGSSMVNTTSNLTKSNIGTYIKAIYRFRPSA